MYREGSKLFYLSNLIDCIEPGDCVNVYFEDGKSTGYASPIKGKEEAEFIEIPSYYQMSRAVMRTYIVRISEERNLIIKTNQVSEGSKFMHVTRIR